MSQARTRREKMGGTDREIQCCIDIMDRLILACLAYHAESGGSICLTSDDMIHATCSEEFVDRMGAPTDLITQAFKLRIQGLAQEGILDDYCITNDEETLPQTTLYALAESSKPRAAECLRKLKEAKG